MTIEQKRRAMFAAYSECLSDGGDTMTPNEIADHLLKVTGAPPHSTDDWDMLVMELSAAQARIEDLESVIKETHSILSELCYNHDKSRSLVSLAQSVDRIMKTTGETDDRQSS